MGTVQDIIADDEDPIRFNPKKFTEVKDTNGLFYKENDGGVTHLNPEKLNFYKYQELEKFFSRYRIIYYTSFVLTIIGLIMLGAAYKQVYKKGREFWLYVVEGFLVAFGVTFLFHVIIFFYIKTVKIEGLIDTVRATMNIYSTGVANDDIHYGAGKLLARNKNNAIRLGNYFSQAATNKGHIFTKLVNEGKGINYQAVAQRKTVTSVKPSPQQPQAQTQAASVAGASDSELAEEFRRQQEETLRQQEETLRQQEEETLRQQVDARVRERNEEALRREGYEPI